MGMGQWQARDATTAGAATMSDAGQRAWRASITEAGRAEKSDAKRKSEEAPVLRAKEQRGNMGPGALTRERGEMSQRWVIGAGASLR